MHGVQCLHVYQPQRSQHEHSQNTSYISMAYNSRLAWLLLSAIAMAVAFYPALASAEVFLVGDKDGWTLNYTIGWPEGKIFKVNDSLVFTYPKGKYTVTEVDSQTFRECYRQGNAIHEWTSGNDTVSLDRPGRRWFFSSMDDHCDMGLKLFVDVVGSVPAQPPSASPAPAPGTLPGSPRHAVAPTTKGTPASHKAPPPATPPSSEKSAAAMNRYYKVDEAVARAAVVAGAVVAAVLM